MAFKNEEELQAFTAWAQEEMQRVAQYTRDSDLIHEEIVGRAVWTLPHRVFIGHVRPKSDKIRSYWVISGSDLPTDHIDKKLAASARDAARHFSYRWQLKCAHLEELGKTNQGHPEGEADWGSAAARLRAQAEALYSLADNAVLWEQTRGDLVSGDDDESATATT